MHLTSGQGQGLTVRSLFHQLSIHSAPIVRHGVGDLALEEKVKQTKSHGHELC